jgi:hypothetical protein
VESGLHANQSLAQLLLELTDKELADVGSKKVPVQLDVPAVMARLAESMPEPPAPGAIAAALARIELKEQALLQELADLEEVQKAMARVAALESRIAEARGLLKDIE